MRTLRHPLFLLCLLLFGISQLLEQLKILIWPVYTHLDDLVCLPVSLTVVLAAERAYFCAPKYILPLRFTLLALLLFSIVFEVTLPLFSEKYTADVLDIVAYAIGAIAFHNFTNKPLTSYQSQP